MKKINIIFITIFLLLITMSLASAAPTITMIDDASLTWTNSDTISVLVQDDTDPTVETVWISSFDPFCDFTKDTDLDMFGTAGVTMTANDPSYQGQNICFRAKNSFGEVDYISSMQILFLDTTAPTLEFVDNVEDGWTDHEDVTLNSNFDNSGEMSYNYEFIGDADICDSSVTFTNVANDADTISINDNSHNGEDICFELVDMAGNSNYVRTDNIIQVDGNAPTILIADDAESNWVTSDTIRATVTDSETSVTSTDKAYTTTYTCDETVMGFTPYLSDLEIQFTASNDGFVCFRATDEAGNTAYESTAQLHVDTDNPVIENVNITPTSPSNDNQPVITFDVTDLTSGVDLATISVFDGTRTFNDGDGSLSCTSMSANDYTCALNYMTQLEDNDYTFTFDAMDLTGNLANQETIDLYTIDTTSPKKSVLVTEETLFEGQLIQTVMLTYNEEMNPSVIPVINFDKGLFTSNNDGSWNDDSNVWTETFTLVDNNEEETVTVTSSDAKDLAGNTEETLDSITFNIDTIQPELVDAIFSHNLIADVNEGETFELFLIYSESLDETVPPTITFSPEISSTLTSCAGVSVGNSYTYTCTIADANVDRRNITTEISLAQDLAGNIQENTLYKNSMDVDTKNPEVVSAIATPNPAKDTEVIVTVEFSEDMDNSAIHPIIDVLGLSQAYQATGTTYSGNTWTGAFTIEDFDEDTIATISVTGDATDLVGNDMIDNVKAGMFNVDTITPETSSVEVSPSPVRSGSQFTVTANVIENHFMEAIAYIYDESNAEVAQVTSNTLSSNGLVSFTFNTELVPGNYRVVVISKDTAFNLELEDENNRETFEVIASEEGDPTNVSLSLSKTSGVTPGETITATCSADFANNGHYEINGLFDSDGVMDIVAKLTDGTYQVTCKAIDDVNERSFLVSQTYNVGSIETATSADLITYFKGTVSMTVKSALDEIYNEISNIYNKFNDYYTKSEIDSEVNRIDNNINGLNSDVQDLNIELGNEVSRATSTEIGLDSRMSYLETEDPSDYDECSDVDTSCMSWTESDITDLDKYTQSEVDTLIESETTARIADVNAEETRAIAAENEINENLATETQSISGLRETNSGVEIQLTKGWTEFRLPAHVLTGTEVTQALDLENFNVETVLDSIDGSYDYIAYYSGSEWMVYSPEGESNNFIVFPTAENTPNYVFSIHMTTTATLNIEEKPDLGERV